MIKFQVENWFAVKSKMEWLFPLHWQEVANYQDKISLEVDFDAYDELALNNNLCIITARKDEKIIGYFWLILKRHLHYKSSLTAFTDIFFIHPDYRKSRAGIDIFKFAEKTMKEMGVQRIITSSKTKHDKSPIFERLGWDKTEIVYTKYIGD